MYIKKLVISNVKSFTGEHTFAFKPGLNFIVGDNNCGKSTLFEALNFLLDYRGKEELLQARSSYDPMRVEVTFAGGSLRQLLVSEPLSRYVEYLHFDSDGDEVLVVERSARARNVVQNGKPVALDVKKVGVWHPEHQQFENPTGIDAAFKALVDIEPVWANTDPTDIADFGSTKTLGKLIESAVAGFGQTPVWNDFVTAHESAFGSSASSLSAHTIELTERLRALVNDQYGFANIKIDFGAPELSSFVKAGRIVVDDGVMETPVGVKGSGMQRAIAIAVIQLYAESLRNQHGFQRPLILMLDEPETWLHPQAQLQLADALSEIAREQQIFLITHSPYMIRRFEAESHELLVFQGMGPQRRWSVAKEMGVLGRGQPSWGEINFHAFGISSFEFHDELYGWIQRHVGQTQDLKRVAEGVLDAFLVSHGFERNRMWRRDNAPEPYGVTLAVYIRNSVHHPENDLNAPVNDQDLESSTRALLGLIDKLAA